MSIPNLPPQGSTNWYGYEQAEDAAVRDAIESSDIGSGDAHDQALQAAFVPRGALVLNVKDPKYGAKGDGSTDDSAAFQAAMAAAKASLRTLPYSLQTEQSVGVIFYVPPGDYLITNPGALLGNEGMTTNGRGLTFRGASSTASNIIFKPSSASALMSNDYWMFVTFENIGFLAATTGCTMMQSYTTHAAQRYSFIGCRFERWKYGPDLQGSDNNSEWTFFNCHIYAHENDGVFFNIGATGNTSNADQFLNHWFENCTFWGTSAPFLDLTYGGSVHIRNLDASNWGGSLTTTGYLFNLRGVTHGEGVCNFEVNGLRWEAANANAALIYTEWPQGNIAFRSVDMSSQQTLYTYGDMIVVYVENTDSAALTFTDSQLAGSVRIKMAPNTYAHKHLIKFEDCTWLQKASPSDVVVYDTTNAGGNNLPLPAVQFIRCRNRSNDVWNTAGAAVWDATMGFLGEAQQDLKERTLSVRGPYGIAWGTEAHYVRLPVGALITGLEVMSPAGAVTEGDGGSWTVATSEATPTTIATATVSTALSAGFDVTTAVSPPFKCGTVAQATLKISATNVAQANAGGLLLIKGYW